MCYWNALSLLFLKRHLFCTFYIGKRLYQSHIFINIGSFFEHRFQSIHCTSVSNKDLQFRNVPQLIDTMGDISGQSAGEMFKGVEDRFHGITVHSSAEPCNASRFAYKLEESLKHWIEKKFRGVWFKVSLEQADWIPILAKKNFTYHHSRNQYVMMYKWLPENEVSNIPPFAHTMVGVGAIVVNSDEEILVVREKYYNVPHWKLPGGYVEPDEDLCDAAVREVLEETSVKTEFQFVVTFRHTHKGMFGCSDIYFIVSLKPLSNKINKCDREIAECQWMKISEFLEHPHVHDGNRVFVRNFLESQETGVTIGCKKGIHAVLMKPQCVFSIGRDLPTEETRSTD